MKRPLVIASLSLISFGVLAAALVSAKSNGNVIGVETVYAPVKAGKYKNVDLGCNVPGNAFYVVDQGKQNSISSAENSFFGGNAKVAIYFFNKDGVGNTVAEAFTDPIPFRYTYEESSIEKYVYEGITPSAAGVEKWQYAIVCRMKPEFVGNVTGDEFWALKWNQSADLSLTDNKNAYWFYQWNDGKVDAYPSGVIEASTILTYFCYAYGIFVRSGWDSAVCAGDATDADTVITQWNQAKSYFNGFGNDVKCVLSNAVADDSDEPFTSTSAFNLPGLAARYDHILTKYGARLGDGANWADR